MSNRLLLTALAALALGACERAQPAHPALWQVEGPHGERAWLFGTVHALPQRLDWKTGKIAQALAQSDALVLEVAHIEEAPAAFAALSQSPGLPPLRDRIGAAMRPAYDRLLGELRLDPARLDPLETWAAALTIEQTLAQRAGIDTANGVERELVADYPRRIDQFEGAATQLTIFDRLAEDDQRALLEGVIAEASSQPDDDADIARAWASGDLTPIEGEIRSGFMADPELHEALLTARNRAWAERLNGMMHRGERPFVAVGAGHMAGQQGLPALLSAQGYTVSRIQ